jgi:catechol-2,3-dioxygenase
MHSSQCHREAVNVSAPDGNGVELSYDRPAEEWTRVDGQLRVYVKKLDREELLAESERERMVTRLVEAAAQARFAVDVNLNANGRHNRR